MMTLTQKTLRGILAKVLSVDEKLIIPKQGNWWNPQENANKPLIAPSFGALIMRSAYFKQNVEIAKQAIDRFDNLLDYKELEYVQNSKQTDEQDIEFKNVTFAYEGSEKNAIENISFKVEKGKTVALVGASGGGKTPRDSQVLFLVEHEATKNTINKGKYSILRLFFISFCVCRSYSINILR